MSALALVHGLAFVFRDTRGRPPHFPIEPLGAELPAARLSTWYRPFADTRSGDAAERTLATAVASRLDAAAVAAVAGIMGAAATDHVFIDGGHTIDFANKAFEVLDHVGWAQAGMVLPIRLEKAHDARADAADRPFNGEVDVEVLAQAVLGDDPAAIVGALDDALDRGATAEELARAVAYAAALRIPDFTPRTTTATGTRSTTATPPPTRPTNASGGHAAAKCCAASIRARSRCTSTASSTCRLPAQTSAGGADLADLDGCWERQGMVDEAGALVYRYLMAGGTRAAVLAALGSAILAEDAEFHWFQTYEAAMRQSLAWPEGSEQAALILAGTARYIAAHTPTRRELPQVVRIAARLRRGDPLYDLPSS
jgi:hypothetical protein